MNKKITLEDPFKNSSFMGAVLFIFTQRRKDQMQKPQRNSAALRFFAPLREMFYAIVTSFDK